MRVAVAFDHRGVSLRDRVIAERVQVASEVVSAFLSAHFDGGERYRRRLSKVEAIEALE